MDSELVYVPKSEFGDGELEGDETYEDFDDGSGDEFVVAASARASRAARSPPPSASALQYEQRVVHEAEQRMHETGHVIVRRVHTTRWGATPVAAARAVAVRVPSSSGGTASKSSGKLSHVFSLQRSIDSGSKESSYLVEDGGGLPLEASQLAAAGMRSCSVRSSVTKKIRKTCAGGMQTSRLSTGMLGSAWAAQTASVAVALGCAERIAATMGCEMCHPSATHSPNVAGLVGEEGREGVGGGDASGPFIVPMTTRLLPHAMPSRLVEHSLLTTMQDFARSELENGLLRQWVPHNRDALRVVCSHVVDSESGMTVWAAWILLSHMLSDPRLRKMVRDTPISDLEVETALLFGAYARAEITRRARIDTANEAKKRKRCEHHLPATAVPTDYAGGGELCSLLLQSNLDESIKARDDSDRATLSLKRKRLPVNGIVHNTGFLSYWAAALDSNYASLLKMLVTQSKAHASSAAVDTLHKQAPEGIAAARNALLVDISGTNAIKSACAISSLVVTTADRVPRVLVWRSREGPGSRTTLRVGIARSLSDSEHSALHACVLAPSHLHPRGENYVRCVWSKGSKEVTPIDAADAMVTGATETHRYLHAVGSGREGFSSRFSNTKLAQHLSHRIHRMFKKGALDLTLSGIARGVVVLRATIAVSDSQCAAGDAIARCVDAAKRVQAEDTAASQCLSPFASHQTLSDTPLSTTAVREPYCSPSTPVALGMQINELLRTALRSRSHRGDPCRHACTNVSEEALAEACADEQDIPGSTLPLVDVRVTLLDDPRPSAAAGGRRLPHRGDSQLSRAALALSVCGDSPVRLNELLDAMCAEEQAATRSIFGTRRRIGTSHPSHPSRPPAAPAPAPAPSHAAAIFEINALTLAGAARASETNEMATSLAASHVNASIASAKRILVADLNVRLYCTLNDVYRVGHSRVAQRFSGTVWAGCYGAGFDLGTSGSMGIRCSSITADKRNHGKILMGQAQVDDWCHAMAHARVVKVGVNEYAHVPMACRGVPHCTIPGLHMYLQHYVSGMERARSTMGIEAVRSVDSLQCMPFSPFSEKLAPYLSDNCNPTTARSFRNTLDHDGSGRAFSVDHTCDDLSIFRPPLVPLTAATCAEDSVFAQAKYSLSSAFGAAAVLARCARTTAKMLHRRHDDDGDGDGDGGPDAPFDAQEAVNVLKELLDALFDGRRPPLGTDFYTAIVAAIMLNCIYPSSHALNGLVVNQGLECAPSAIAHSITADCPTGKSLPQLLTPELLKCARKFWAPFVRSSPDRCAWSAVEPLLLQLLVLNGRHDLSLEDYDAVWRANELLIKKGGWLVASPDGAAPPLADSRLCGVRGWESVISEHVSPRIVKDERGNPPQATLVGVMPAGFQQILALLQASAALPEAGAIPEEKGVVVQLAHNYGQLIFRPSAAADILTSSGTPRSDKSVSVLGVDGDEAAFGSRQSKIESCKLQRSAWRQNLQFVKPLCAAIAPPMPEKILTRGCSGEVDYIDLRRRELQAGHGMKTVQEEDAQAAFDAALAQPWSS